MPLPFSAQPQSRREFISLVACGTTALLGCNSSTGNANPSGGIARLTARPTTPVQSITAGSYPLTPSNPNDGYLVVPAGYNPATPTPLILALHGASAGAGSSISLLGPRAADHGFLLLAVGARGLTWDVFSYKFSYDVTFIDTSLRFAFERCNVDAARCILQGFSDGASYALELGRVNGDLFPRVIVNSPGFIPASDSAPTGKPQFYITHGKQDPILNIDNASRKIVPKLRSQGYDVTYVEFDGGHEVPPAILTQAVEWAIR